MTLLAPPLRFSVDVLSERDAVEVVALHRAVFASDASASWHVWKYARGVGVGVRNSEGHLIAHCGGIYRPLLRNGEVMTGLQIGDVMVARGERGWLTRHGPFFKASDRLYGPREDGQARFDLVYGFPSARHLRLGQIVGLQRDSGPIMALEWNTALRPVCRERCVPAASSDALRRPVQTAWATMRASLGYRVAGVRDFDYVQWRYLTRPDQSYLVLVLQTAWRRSTRGVLVLRQESASDWLWLDWIGATEDISLATNMACSVAAERGGSVLKAWVSPGIAEALAGTRPSRSAVVTQFATAVSSGLNVDSVLASAWWWMGGDTDFL